MSISIPLQIQRMTGLEAPAMTCLRKFDLEWRCGTHFIYLMLLAGHKPELIAAALNDALASYQRMCRDGVNDFIRLRLVLGHVVKILTTSGDAPSTDNIEAWCESTNVPQLLREHLING
ncbi:hypothetical protein [Pseudomonas sp. 2FE]|uniref:hypothetical protein n=1 Tax=Pseudomonas sp. 2FE TaxID=2502190 RepID=UPI0010F45798|nr:hypothetical protein [Pseudomonas sp. 2FE]